MKLILLMTFYYGSLSTAATPCKTTRLFGTRTTRLHEIEDLAAAPHDHPQLTLLLDSDWVIY